MIFSHRRVLLQAFSHIRWAEQQENRVEGHERDKRDKRETHRERKRERQELVGDRKGKWNKVKEETWREWQWEKSEKHFISGGECLYGETKHRHTENHWHIYRFQERNSWHLSVITYGLSGLSRQALSIPGNVIMLSTSRLELGFWLLWSQETKSQL